MLSKLLTKLLDWLSPPTLRREHVMAHVIRQEMDQEPCQDPTNWLEPKPDLRPLSRPLYKRAFKEDE